MKSRDPSSMRHEHSRMLSAALLTLGGTALFCTALAALYGGQHYAALLCSLAGMLLAGYAFAQLSPFGRPTVVRVCAAMIALDGIWGAAKGFSLAEPRAWIVAGLAALVSLAALTVLFAAGSGWHSRTSQFNADPRDPAKRIPWAYHGDERLLVLSPPKLATFHPEWTGPQGVVRDLLSLLAGRFCWRSRGMLESLAQGGDARAAVVVSMWPLTIAVYTDEIDAVCLLEYPDALGVELGERYGLEVGSRLLGLAAYRNGPLAADLVRGPAARESAGQVWPVVGDFLCANMSRVETLKALIPESEWQRAKEMGARRVELAPHGARSGLPLESFRAAVASPAAS